MLKWFFAGKPERKDSLGSHGRTWKDNIKTNRTEIGPEDVEWSHVAQWRGQWRTLAHKVP